ncbi:MAG: hypothetical protein R3C59_14340 [Planctomycetaceae bacterium]
MTADVQATIADDVHAKLKELKLELNPDLPYRLEKMFPRLQGWGVKGEIKARVKLLNQAEPGIRQMLLPKEEVLFVSKGVKNSIFEALTIGALWANMINQTVFVLTNARLIMAHCNRHGQVAEPCWMIYYSEIQDFKSSFTGTVTLKLKDKSKYQFSGFPKTDRKTMPLIFEEAFQQYQALGFEPECTQSRENLCRQCFSVVSDGTFECTKCGSTFWTAKEIALRSLVFPAWGDLIMKHYPLAGMEILGYVLTWFVVVGLIHDGEIGAALLVLLIAHSIDAAVTYTLARKGLYTKQANRP